MTAYFLTYLATSYHIYINIIATFFRTSGSGKSLPLPWQIPLKMSVDQIGKKIKKKSNKFLHVSQISSLL